MVERPVRRLRQTGLVTLGDLDWESLAKMGSNAELVQWGREYHHIDLTDDDTVLSLAANAVLDGGWRNGTEMEAIHVSGHKRRDQPKAGLSDAEMMIGNIEVANAARRHLASGHERWYFDLEDELCDFDRAYAGQPLSSYVTKVGLRAHKRQVGINLWRFHLTEQLVGRDRFLRGLALVAMDHVFWGSPLWPTQVDAWADAATTRPGPTTLVVAQMKADPTCLPLADVEEAVRTGIGYAHGRQRWHRQHCGEPDHRPGSDHDEFLGFGHHVYGIPMPWVAAALLRPRDEEG